MRLTQVNRNRIINIILAVAFIGVLLVAIGVLAIRMRYGRFEPLDSITRGAAETKKLVFFAVCFFSIVSFLLFAVYYFSHPEERGTSGKRWPLTLGFIIFFGTAIRLFLAISLYGNYDMESYEIVCDILAKGGNVYAETSRYNYSPVWFLVLSCLKTIHLQAQAVPFHFIVRSFLTIIDLATLAFLLLIAKQAGISRIRTAILFYLNPVSYLITGYHGQFENLAILMIVIGIYLFIRFKGKPVIRIFLLWLFSTSGMIVKHNIFYENLICQNYATGRWRKGVGLFALSSVLFLCTFIPYWEEGSGSIIRHVFMYGSGTGTYGMTRFLNAKDYKYIFIMGMFIFPFFLRSQDLVHRCLLGTLFFLSFTSGMANQYQVLPIALGSLLFSRGFFWYSLITCLFLLGSRHNIALIYHLPRNVVWIFTLAWFFLEMRYNNTASKRENGMGATL